MRTITTRPRIAVLGLAAAGLLAIAILLAANPTSSSAGSAPNRTVLAAAGKVTFQPNGFFRDGQHFAPGVSTVQSGGRIVFINRTKESHTFSVVRRSQQPDTLNESFACYGPNGACNAALEAHRFNDNNPRNDRPEVNAGSDGFDRVGDSIVLNPGQRRGRTFSAPAGRNLYFLCVFHPQMQARVGAR